MSKTRRACAALLAALVTSLLAASGPAPGTMSHASADDRFVAMMIPHHEGAIDMATAELRGGRNQQLRRLAQEIIVTQRSEIEAMRSILKRNDVTGASLSKSSVAAPSVSAVSHRDRVYAAEQFSNTVSVIDPADNRLLGVIRLGDPLPGNLSPLYRGQLLVHGMGFSPDHRTLAIVSIGSNSVTFIDTPTNTVKHVTYVGRSPHEAFFTPDGSEVWVTVRGESHVAVLDGKTYVHKARIDVPNGPGMQIFSPDGRYGYVCSSFTPQTVVVDVRQHRIVGRVTQESPFCPNIAVTPDGKQVWLTLKDVGRVMVFDARPPFAILKTIASGPTTNHVNIARNANGMLAYVTVGGLNEVQVYRTDDFSKVATIPVGPLPHGVWPSDDGTRVYVGLENQDAMVAIDALTNRVLATVPIGQAPQAIAFVSNAVPEGGGLQNLQPLGVAGQVEHLTLAPPNATTGTPTTVAIFEQGLQQMLQASVTGLVPQRPYVLALSQRPDGTSPLEPLQPFTTNAAGSAIVNAIGPIRQIVRGDSPTARRYLVIVGGTPGQLGSLVQLERP
jgi:YVTN family beta-propeller protein